MARQSRQRSAVGLYHTIARGNNKTNLFHRKDDFKPFLGILSSSLEKYPVKIHHYCLMSNHIHLLIGTDDIKALSRYMHAVQRSYHHYYRKNYSWFGHLFQGRYRSIPIETDAHLLDCGRYIERNPVRAKLAPSPDKWPYSSYGVYAYGARDPLVTKSVAYEALADNDETRQRMYRDHVESIRPYEEVIDQQLVGIN